MNKPNLGMLMANIPVIKTMSVLIITLLRFSLPRGFGIAAKHLVFSVMSIAGITCMGNVPKRPKQYSSCTLEVRLSCGRFMVTMSSILSPKAS